MNQHHETNAECDHSYSKNNIYRARDGVIFGVCKGFADHFDFPVLWLRVGTVVAFILTGIWPTLIAYVVAALVMKPEPVVPFREGAAIRSSTTPS